MHLSNGDFNFNSGFNGDGGNLLDDFRGRVQVDQTLVDLHLELVKGFGTVTTRRLTGGDAKDLGGETNGTLDLELLVFGTLNEVAGNLFKVLDVTRRQGDTNAVDPIEYIYQLIRNSPRISFSTYLASTCSSKPGLVADLAYSGQVIIIASIFFSKLYIQQQQTFLL